MVPLWLGGSRGEVVGPVSARVSDPADCGVDVEAEEVGEDSCREVGGERCQGAVAAGRALMPCRLSRLVRLCPSMGCPGTQPGNSHLGAFGPWES